MSKRREHAAAEVFFALGDRTRLAVVRRLGAGARTATALADGAAVSRQAIVKHLQVLEASSIVRTSKVGRVRTCTVEPKMLTLAEHWIAARREQWERKLDRLAEYLDATASENDNDQTGESK